MMNKQAISVREIVTGVMALSAVVLAGSADAKGAIKGAAKGAVVGHVLGHHAKAGAAIGAVHGHHQAAKQARRR
jgi:hypothetical protein